MRLYFHGNGPARPTHFLIGVHFLPKSAFFFLFGEVSSRKSVDGKRCVQQMRQTSATGFHPTVISLAFGKCRIVGGGGRYLEKACSSVQVEVHVLYFPVLSELVEYVVFSRLFVYTRDEEDPALHGWKRTQEGVTVGSCPGARRPRRPLQGAVSRKMSCSGLWDLFLERYIFVQVRTKILEKMCCLSGTL